MAKVIVTSSWKGGTGKTTLNVLTAEILALRKQRVLVIDLDSNCSLSVVYDRTFRDRTSKDFLTGGTWQIYDAKPGIDIIPSDLQIGLLSNIMDTQLKVAIRKSGLAEKYDYILIDPPGYWGPHTRNAIFAADILVVAGTCSKLDFSATVSYIDMLQQCAIEADTYVAVNGFSARANEPGIYEQYQRTFGDFLVPEPVPEIASLRRMTANPTYEINPAVRVRLERYVDHIIGGAHA